MLASISLIYVKTWKIIALFIKKCGNTITETKVKVQTLFKKQFYSLLNSKHRLTDGCDRVHKQFVALSITQIHYRHIAKREKRPVIDSTIDKRCIDNRTTQMSQHVNHKCQNAHNVITHQPQMS